MAWKNFTLTRYRRPVRVGLILAVIIAAAAWQCEVSLGDLMKGIAKGLSMLSFFFPPDWSAFPEMIHPALVTVVICLIATPLGAALSVFFGLAGARNLAPGWLRLFSRSLIAGERSLPEIVTLLILVAAF